MSIQKSVVEVDVYCIIGADNSLKCVHLLIIHFIIFFRLYTCMIHTHVLWTCKSKRKACLLTIAMFVHIQNQNQVMITVDSPDVTKILKKKLKGEQIERQSRTP